MLGNSHGVELAYALAQDLKNYNLGLRHHTMSGCPISYQLTLSKDNNKNICTEWTNYAVKDILASSNIKVVVISYRIDFFFSEQKYQDSLYNLVNDLTAHGKKVIVVLQAPMLTHHINYFIRHALGRSNVDNIPLAEWKKTNSEGYRIAGKLKSKAQVIDPVEEYCDNTECYAIRNNISLFIDDNHMSVDGAALVVKKFMPGLIHDLGIQP